MISTAPAQESTTKGWLSVIDYGPVPKIVGPLPR